MSRPLAPPPTPPAAPPAEPAPQSRNARLLRSAIVFGSFLISLILLKLVIPEIPTRPLVIASGALGGFFALDIFNIRQEENARELRARNRNGREAGQTAEIALEQINVEIEPVNQEAAPPCTWNPSPRLCLLSLILIN